MHLRGFGITATKWQWCPWVRTG